MTRRPSSRGRAGAGSTRRGPFTALPRPVATHLRRVVAALLAAATVGLTVHVLLSRPAPDDVPALVAARPVAVGQLLAEADLEVRHLPPRTLPEGALTGPAEAVGQLSAGPLAPGEVLTATDLGTAGLLTGLADDRVAVFLPLAEPAVPQALAPADRVDVHSPVDGSVVVGAALVLRTSSGEQPGLWLAVDRPGAAALAAARGSDPAGAAMQVAVAHP